MRNDIKDLTLRTIRAIREELKFTDVEKANGKLWFPRARKVRDNFGLTDKDILDIINNRVVI